MIIYLSNGDKDDLNRSLTVIISNSLLSRSFGAGLCAPNPPPGNLWSRKFNNYREICHLEGGIDMEMENLPLSLINTV